MFRKIIATAVIVTAFAWQGCEEETVDEPVDCNVNPVEVQLSSVEHSNCGATDGEVTLSATGGNGKYKFAIDGGTAQESGVFAGLGAGTYEVTATDGNNCSSTMEVEVLNMEGLNIDVESADSGCKTTQGGVTVTAFDGNEPYAYKLGDAAFSTSNTFSGLGSGDYPLTVRDASGCEVNQTVKVRSGVSFDASISPIIENKCAVSGCHNGSQAPDLRVFKNIHDNAGTIKTVTGNGSMPQNGTLTQNEKDLIACWVDDGALDN